MNYLSRLNAWLDKTAVTAQEKVANKRLAKKKNLEFQGAINQVEQDIADIEDTFEDYKNSKDLKPCGLWDLQKKLMLKEKQIEFYKEQMKELF